MTVTSSLRNWSGIRHVIDFYICMPNQYLNSVRGRTECLDRRYWLAEGHKVTRSLYSPLLLPVYGRVRLPACPLPWTAIMGNIFSLSLFRFLRRFQLEKRSIILEMSEKWQVRFLYAECGALFWDSTHYHYALALESVLLALSARKRTPDLAASVAANDVKKHLGIKLRRPRHTYRYGCGANKIFFSFFPLLGT